MNYIVYTTEGHTELPNGTDVENCQIVDFVYNTLMSKSEVVGQTAKNFNLRTDKMNAAVCIHEKEIEAIRQVVNYLWNSEEHHYEESDIEDKEIHIFKSIKMLAEYFGK